MILTSFNNFISFMFTVRIPDVASVVSLVPKKTPLALATTKISK